MRIPTIGMVLLVLLLLCGFGAMQLLSPGGPDEEPLPALPTREAGFLEPTRRPTSTTVPQPFTPPAPAVDGQSWLVMLYQDADDRILERNIYIDLNEAERVGSSDRLHIVAQVDRFRRGYEGDGNWMATKRFYVTQDDDLERVASQEVADLGELNMADGDTLVDFVTWAVATFPANKHALILSDHGMGWPGGWTDPEPGGRGGDNVALAEMGDQLFLMELDEALQEIRARSGLDKLELIGLDACLMGHVEVMSALAPHARYAVASQEVEPALGWAYTAFLHRLQQNPDMDGAELGRAIVDSYVREDERIVNQRARAQFLGEGRSLGGLFGLSSQPSAEQLAGQMEDDVTLSLIDLQAMPRLMDALNALASTLAEIRQPVVAASRSYAQSFTSVFGQEVPPSYIDLGHFARVLAEESGDRAVGQAVDQLGAAIDQAVIAERHGRKKPGATGLSIYFPTSQLYRSPYAGPQSYTDVAQRFAGESLWDDFLAFHYTGEPFEPGGGLAVPLPGTPIRGPGSGTIQIDPVALSDDVAAPGQPVILSTEIRGENIGYLYLLAGFYDQTSNSIFVADMDYLESGDTREIDGVYYPDWGEEGAISIEFEWEPIVYAINDGVDSVPALFSPEEYGGSPEEAVYTVEGMYTFADGSEPRYARLYFSNGLLKQVYGYTSETSTGAPWEIVPQPGDMFTVLERWIDLGQEGQPVQFATQDGGTVTFGTRPLSWIELGAAAGEYVVGFVVEDLDGNSYTEQTTVTVR